MRNIRAEFEEYGVHENILEELQAVSFQSDFFQSSMRELNSLEHKALGVQGPRIGCRRV